MEEQIMKVFDRIGMNKNETKIYLDLLKFKNSSAFDISKRTGIHRSNSYDALRKLIEIGFITETVGEKKRLFSSMDPEKIKFYLKQQQREVDEMIPYLNGIISEKPETESISIKKGIFAIRESLYDLLKIGKTIYVYGVSKKSIDSFGEGFLKEFNKERISRKISMIDIYDETALNSVKHLKGNYTETKFLPKKYCSNVVTIICDPVVIMVVFNNPTEALIIKNKEIFKTYSKYFEIFWRDAKYRNFKPQKIEKIQKILNF